MTSFKSEYNRLNSEQKRAVDSIEGPVMVIAGPGTGKTQTLALRTAHILQKTHVNPSNILCLTFSLSGTKAMRERLRQIIGPEAYSVVVNTVHGFCNELILQYPQVFEEFRALEQVSDIERLRIVRRAFAALPAGSILGKPAIDRDRAADVLSRIGEMKREGIHPEQLEEALEQYKEEITTTKTGKQRDPSSAAYKQDEKKVQQFEEFIAVYRGYQLELHASHRYDYEDMILFCIEALKEHEWLLVSLQEQYQYVLVDEFQDLNGAQNEILNILTSYVHTDHTPNIFVVGDDDQAIYRFQGASIGNMQGFLERFKETEVITLTQNYRSVQPVLDTARSIITHNNERLEGVIDGVQKELVSVQSDTTLVPEFQRFESTELEYAGIVEVIAEHAANGVPYSEMAILCNRNREIHSMAEALSAADVPAVVCAKDDLFAEPIVLEIVALLRAIVSIDNNVVLSSALACSTLGHHPLELGTLWTAHRAAKSENPECTLFQYCLDSFDTLSEAMQKHITLLIDCANTRQNRTLPDLLEHLLHKAGFIPDATEKLRDPRDIAAVHAFYDYVKNRCYEQKNVSLEILLDDIDQYLTEPSLKLQYELPHLVSEGVQLMTAHASKGLEFDVVIIPHVRYGNWDHRRGGMRLTLPNHLIYNVDLEVEKTADREDERRLFYVACTRARTYVHCTFAEQFRSGEQLRSAQVSGFIAEAGQTIEEKKLDNKNLQPIETLLQPELHIDTAFEAFLRERLEHFELSVTSLNAFLESPREFMWKYLLQQPQAKAAHLAYGTAVHAALEKRNLAWKSGDSFTASTLVDTFVDHIQRRELFTTKEREHYLHTGSHVLTRYGQQTEGNLPIVLHAERGIKARLNDIPLTGKVDRIDLLHPNSRECRIVDYKTGSPKKTQAAVQKDEKLYRQLVFYKLLTVHCSSFMHDASVFALDFVGNESSDRSYLEFTITQQELKELEQVVVEVWKRIQNLDFNDL